jgi:hypothetical protein
VTTIIDDIEDAMIAGSLNCRITYGMDVDEVETTKLITDYGVARIFQPTSVDPSSEMVVSSGGALWDVAAMMICINTTAKSAVDSLHAWLVGIGFVTENGVVGIPPGAPWTFQTLSIYKWQPAGGLPMRAERLGDKWVALVACEIQLRKV